MFISFETGAQLLKMLAKTDDRAILTDAAYAVRQSDLDAYRQNGAVLLKSVFSQAWIHALRESADKALSQSENYFRRQRVWEYDDTCREYCLNTSAPAIAAALMNCVKVNLLYDQVFTKNAGNPATPWHNDLPYWPVRNGRAATVWLALDPIGLNSGPLEFIAGSHSWNQMYQPFTTVNDGSVEADYKGAENQFVPMPDFDVERDRHTVLCWEMQAGDVLVFDAMIVHGARNNSSSAVRRGYAVRYTCDSMTYHRGAEVNPRITNPNLLDGQPLDSDQYPAIRFRS